MHAALLAAPKRSAARLEPQARCSRRSSARLSMDPPRSSSSSCGPPLCHPLPAPPSPQVILVICVIVWAINYHHFVTFAWVPGRLLPDWGASTFSLAKCTYYFKIAVRRRAGRRAG